MLTAVYNQKGEKIEEIELPSEIFNVKMNLDLVHQIINSQIMNKRQGTAHTKTRGEVSGGGKKPWQQKGLGKARHGSTRSPLWRHGGITFGPRNDKNFKKTIPQKMRQKAVLMILSEKLKQNALILLDTLKIEQPKTKNMIDVLKKFPSNLKSSLIVIPKIDKNIILSSRNIPKVQIMQTKDLNCLSLLSYKYLVLLKESIEQLKTLLKI